MWWGWRQNLSVRGTKGIWVLWAGWWKLSIKGIKVSKLRKEEGWLVLPESGSNTEIVFVLILGLKLSLSKLVQNILQNFLKLYNSVLLDINTVSDIGADLMYIFFFFSGWRVMKLSQHCVMLVDYWSKTWLVHYYTHVYAYYQIFFLFQFSYCVYKISDQ